MENYDTRKEQRKEGSGEEQLPPGAAVLLNELPEGCIAKIVSLTTPPDACRLSCVSTTNRSAAASDCVWGSFLPSDYQTILSTSSDPPFASLSFSSKKDLFFYLSLNPVLIDEGKKSFSVDKWSGKKIYMIAPRDLGIVWGDTPAYWEWISHPESRFKEVARLKLVWWLEIRGKISTSMLSRDTNYAAYLVFKLEEEAYGFDYCPAEVSLLLGADELRSKSVLLEPRIEMSPPRQRIGQWYGPHVIDHDVLSGLQRPEKRADGWLEIELGDFFNGGGEDEVEMKVMEVKAGRAKGGLILQGIEIRPIEGK